MARPVKTNKLKKDIAIIAKSIEPVQANNQTEAIDAIEAIEENPVSISQITHPKKKAFLEIFYATDGNVSECTRTVGVSRKLFYHWLSRDPVFNELINQQKEMLLDDMDMRLRNRAKSVKGTAELIFWLKTHHRDYRQKETIGFKDGEKEFILSRG